MDDAAYAHEAAALGTSSFRSLLTVFLRGTIRVVDAISMMARFPCLAARACPSLGARQCGSQEVAELYKFSSPTSLHRLPHLALSPKLSEPLISLSPLFSSFTPVFSALRDVGPESHGV
jgi:hypothetical protein